MRIKNHLTKQNQYPSEQVNLPVLETCWMLVEDYNKKHLIKTTMTKYTYDPYTMTYWFQTEDGEWDEVLEIPENKKKG